MLGERLRQLRLDRGMTIEELSDRLDIPVDCMLDVEAGKRRLSRPTISEAASIFSVAEAELAAEDQPAAPVVTDLNPELTPERIGRRIRELREEKEFSMNQLARKAGLSAAHLSEVERGLTAASLKTLEKLADVLEVPVAVLLGSAECDPLGERLRRLRERVGLTQKELAEMVGVSHTLVGQVETGRLVPSVATLTRLAGVLGVSPCYFLIENAGTRTVALEDHFNRALSHREVRDFLTMIGTLADAELGKVLGMLSWLTDRHAPYREQPADSHVRELLQIMAGLNPDEKGFLMESARFLSRKVREERKNDA